jgi:hypothetical protein
MVITDDGQIHIADSDLVGNVESDADPRKNRIINVNPQSGAVRVVIDGTTAIAQRNPFSRFPPESLCADRAGNLHAISAGHIFKIQPQSGAITKVALGPILEPVHHNQPGRVVEVKADASSHLSPAIGLDAAGDIYALGDDGLVKIAADSGLVATVLEKSTLQGADRSEAFGSMYLDISADRKLAVDPAGDIFFIQPESPSRFGTRFDWLQGTSRTS